MTAETPGRTALAQLDKALAAKPDAAGHAFSAAAHALSQMRDGMAAGQRRDGATPESRQRLEHVNAVISVVLAGHFPLEEVPWDELKKAREWLVQLTQQDMERE